MTKPKKRPKRKAPPLGMPGQIDASAEEIAETVLAAKPPPNWKYLERGMTSGADSPVLCPACSWPQPEALWRLQDEFECVNSDCDAVIHMDLEHGGLQRVERRINKVRRTIEKANNTAGQDGHH